jgi:altronate hydrolase
MEIAVPNYPMNGRAILLNTDDDVAVAVRALAVGDTLEWEGGSCTVQAPIPAGHKLAVRAVEIGEPVRKYGQIIGYALQQIAPGDWVHTHNLGHGPARREYEFAVDLRHPPVPAEERTFLGYSNPSGRAGTRNYLALISTVNCSADTVHLIAQRLRSEVLPDFPNVDGVAVVAHGTGCGMQLGGKEYRLLQRCLAGIANHPNVAAALFVGLGCEVNQPTDLLRNEQILAPRISAGASKPTAHALTIQQAGGVRKAVQAAMDQALPLLRQANARRRVAFPIAHLAIGTNCGGSDGNSGITANPALGLAGDRFVAHGATWVLAETTETYGAEHLLTRRAVNQEIGEKLLSHIRWWEDYVAAFGASIDNNPAPGNKEGGLTTIYEKSLGAVAKSGSTPLRAVYEFAEPVREPGLCFMDTPGLDNVSVTGLVCGGCNLVAFTTGRGSCLGFKPTPVLKVATNSALYEHMPDDMDVDAGVILHGVPMREVADTLFEELIAVASGKQTKSEAQGLGDFTFTPWALGPVL